MSEDARTASIEPWQAQFVDEMMKAHGEGRTEIRWVQGRKRAGFMWVRPTSENGSTGESS